MFEQEYPFLAKWTEYEGRIEIGAGYLTNSILRIISEGGMVWEDHESKTVNEALKKGEEYLKNDFKNEFGYKIGE